MRPVTLTAGCLLLLAVSSCTGTPESVPQGPCIPIEEEQLTQEMITLPEGVVVRQRTSGGLLPVEREWLFYSDGRIRHPNGDITRLEQDDAATVLSAEEFRSLERLAKDYPAPPGSADFVTMDLTFRGPAGVCAITAADSSEQVPDQLFDYWDRLQQAARRSLQKR